MNPTSRVVIILFSFTLFLNLSAQASAELKIPVKMNVEKNNSSLLEASMKLGAEKLKGGNQLQAHVPSNGSESLDYRILPKSIYYYYFSKSHPDGILMENFTSLDKNMETKIIIHGWRSDSSDESVIMIRNAYLNFRNVNIVLVDWGEIAENLFYPYAAKEVLNVGEDVGNFINGMVKDAGMDYGKIHIVGFSLGAHVAGKAGKVVSKPLYRITGLDPAGPCFESSMACAVLGLLQKEDASFVDIIHTSPGLFGVEKKLGHVDFFPNDDPVQPGCQTSVFPFNLFSRRMLTARLGKALLFPSGETCSHARAYKYFAESIVASNFLAIKCDSWEDFRNKKCAKIYQKMGEEAVASNPGVFYLETNSEAPFAKGSNGILNQ